jgi:hypothetical protein
LHLFFGVAADVMLGANLPDATLAEPVLDSQNRFYGVSFPLFGTLLYLCSTDLKKYKSVFQCVLGTFFLAGLARCVSIYTHGIPPSFILILLGSELALPPVLYIWYSALERKS